METIAEPLAFSKIQKPTSVIKFFRRLIGGGLAGVRNRRMDINQPLINDFFETKFSDARRCCCLSCRDGWLCFSAKRQVRERHFKNFLRRISGPSGSCLDGAKLSGEKLSIPTEKPITQPTELFHLGELTKFWNPDWKLERAGFGGTVGGSGNLRGITYLEGDLAARPNSRCRAAPHPKTKCATFAHFSSWSGRDSRLEP